MGGLGSPYGQPGHHSPNGGGSVSSKRTINRSEWESRCLRLSVLPFRSANYTRSGAPALRFAPPQQGVSYVHISGLESYMRNIIPDDRALPSPAFLACRGGASLLKSARRGPCIKERSTPHLPGGAVATR